ncbi:hypothetical protein IWQ60_008568 [Tieghemiomyces parasiticus]|uniref:Uncharacterized protein n=1 Tax=Tieghemiomyces parasiticus TaxID=78921 RepID=A0A9W8DRS5_9FUNG|nr:hypothetical protein IWQ60_008568 [Tieghemiomyces parasiticus]
MALPKLQSVLGCLRLHPGTLLLLTLSLIWSGLSVTRAVLASDPLTILCSSLIAVPCLVALVGTFRRSLRILTAYRIFLWIQFAATLSFACTMIAIAAAAHGLEFYSATIYNINAHVGVYVHGREGRLEAYDPYYVTMFAQAMVSPLFNFYLLLVVSSYVRELAHSQLRSASVAVVEADMVNRMTQTQTAGPAWLDSVSPLPQSYGLQHSLHKSYDGYVDDYSYKAH